MMELYLSRNIKGDWIVCTVYTFTLESYSLHSYVIGWDYIKSHNVFSRLIKQNIPKKDMFFFLYSAFGFWCGKEIDIDN